MDYEQKYEKKYNEAIERMKSWAKGEHPECFSEAQKTAEFIFPEIKENEDEKIRKDIIDFLRLPHPQFVGKRDHEKWIDWLEKQGKKKPYGQRKQCSYCQFNYAGECKGFCQMKRNEQKPIDKVESKFHEGEWITNGYDTWKIVGVKPLDYILQSQDGNIVDDTISYVDEQFHSFTIEDAKDGDVLVVNNEVFIYAHRKQMYSIAVAHCFVDSAGGFYLDGEFGYEENGKTISPATKEQRDLLFQKMTEAGYEWDSEKKELKKIE